MFSTRLRLTRLVVVLCVGLSLGAPMAARGNAAVQAESVTTAAAASTDDWAQSGYDARKANYNPSERMIGPTNVASLRPVWSIPQTVFDVVIADGRLYRVLGHQVVAARVSDGTTLWSYEFPAGCPAWVPRHIAASASRVFVSFSDDCSETGRTDQALVVALDAATGQLLWQIPAGAHYVAWLGLASDHLLVQQAELSGLSVLDPVNGQEQWSTWSTTGELEGAYAADDTHLYFSGSNYTTGQDFAAAFRLSDGATDWSRPLGPAWGAMIVSDGSLFIGGLRPNTFEPVLRVLDASTGAFRFRVKNVNLKAYQPGRFLATDPTGQILTARDPRTGAAIWSRTFRKALAGPVVVANGVAYTTWYGSSNQSLRTYRTTDGKLLVNPPGYTSVAAVAGGTVYATDTYGFLTALRPMAP